MVRVGGLGRSLRHMSAGMPRPVHSCEVTVLRGHATDNFIVGGQANPPTITTNRKDNPCGR